MVIAGGRVGDANRWIRGSNASAECKYLDDGGMGGVQIDGYGGCMLVMNANANTWMMELQIEVIVLSANRLMVRLG